jgi:non-specific serine/threonine protein kinase
MSEALLAEGLELAKKALDSEAFAIAWEDGRRMSVEEGIAEALGVELRVRSPRRHTRGDPDLAGLTPAELEVLRLLAHGRTTKEIAEALVVAVSTVDRHLTHIYTKLGVRNRAAATSFAVTHGLAE